MVGCASQWTLASYVSTRCEEPAELVEKGWIQQQNLGSYSHQPFTVLHPMKSLFNGILLANLY